MPSHRTPTTTRGPLAKKCRTCHDLHPVGALTFGQNLIVLEGVDSTLRPGLRGRATFAFD